MLPDRFPPHLRYERFFPWKVIPPRQQDAKGRWLCRWCGKPCPKGRFSWCSGGCYAEFLVRFSAANVRYYVFERDQGVCAKCGINTEWLENQARRIYRVARRMRGLDIRGLGAQWGPWPVGAWGSVSTSLWEADHIVPVVEGGGCCGLDNYQTLCVPCHKAETAALAARRARARDPQMELALVGCTND